MSTPNDCPIAVRVRITGDAGGWLAHRRGWLVASTDGGRMSLVIVPGIFPRRAQCVPTVLTRLGWS